MLFNLAAVETGILMTVFGIIFGVLAVCALVVFILDLVLIKKRKEARSKKPASPEPVLIQSEDLTVRIKDAAIDAFDTPAEQPELIQPQPESEPAPVEEPESEPEEIIDGVLIPKIEKLTFAEKYEKLEEEQRALLDEFSAYVVGKEDCSKQLQVSSLTFKYKKGQIAKAVIRRDLVYLNFAILNPDFGRMMREEKSSGLKVKPVEVRLSTAEELEVAKQTADITIGYLKQEDEYRIEKRKEARREAMRQKREEEAAQTEAAEE